MNSAIGHARRQPWSYWLGALSIAICAAEIAYRVANGPGGYSQFTVGSITWSNTGKNADFALLLGLFVGFACSWLALVLLEKRVQERLGGVGTRRLRALVGYASLPAVIWAGGLLLGSGEKRGLVWLAAVAVGLSAALMLRASAFSSARGAEGPPDTAPGVVMLVTAFGSVSALIAIFAINRLTVFAKNMLLWTGTPSALLLVQAGGAAALLLGLWAWGAGSPPGRRLYDVVLGAQLLLPWGFLAVIPTPWVADSLIVYGLPPGRILLLVLVLILLAYIDLARRLRFVQGTAAEPAPEPLRALSPLALAGGLIFVKLEPVIIGYLPSDDFHFGEHLLPWWLLVDHADIPFWDYVPTRGLIDYASGAAASLVFENTAAGILASPGLIAAGVLIIGLLSLRALIGLLPAVAVLLLMPISRHLSQIDVLNTSALALLWVGYCKLRPVTWLALWLGLGTVLFLAAPAQGSALVLATIPIAVWQVVRGYREEKGRLRVAAALSAGSAIALLAVTPLGRMLLGALRYGAENSAVSGPAHGIVWSAGAMAATPLNRWAWEAVRVSWMLVGFAAVAILLLAWVRRERREILVVRCLPIVILVLAFIYRAAGRIDPGSVSRMGYASIWMLALLLPVLLHAAWGSERWPAILTLSMAGASMLAPVLGPVSLEVMMNRPAETLTAPPGLAAATRSGLTRIGRVAVQPAHLARLVAIREALEVLLDPDETYLDLTNRNAHYFYLERYIPIESGALYNLPNERQQLRAVRAIDRQQIAVVLAYAVPTLLHDGGPQSYRAYAIYRYLALRYVPVKIDDLIFLVLPDRLTRLRNHGGLSFEIAEPAVLWDAVFRQDDLQGLPASWGTSWHRLEPAATPVLEAALYGPPTATDAVPIGADTFQATGARPAIEWDLSPAHIAGKKAGVLTFDFACLIGSGDTGLEVGWGVPGGTLNADSTVRFRSHPRVAVPLDASPRWLQSPTVGTLRIAVGEPERCPEFSISNATLWQRDIATAVDPV